MPTALQPPHPANPASGAKILLVDDGQEWSERLVQALRRAGLRPLRASNLSTALELFDAQRPDLAVIEVNFGSWSGLDLLEELRKRSSLPILMLAGSISEQLDVRSIELGADDFLSRPMETEHLVTRIRARLAHNRQAREQLEIHVQLSAGLRELVETGDRLLVETQEAVRARDQLLMGIARDLQPALVAIQRLAQRRRLRSAHAGRPIDPLVGALEQIENRTVSMAESIEHLLGLAALEIEWFSEKHLGQPGQSVEGRGARQERILVVEDDETIRGAIIDLLRRDGYSADGAGDGKQALEMLHVQRAAAIVLDLRMPVMDGWTFVERYHHQHSDAVPIIVISAAHDLASSAKRLRTLGVRVCLAKPFDVEALLAVVGRFVPHAA
jgi:DNA-binding response OmpR family regulator